VITIASSAAATIIARMPLDPVGLQHARPRGHNDDRLPVIQPSAR